MKPDPSIEPAIAPFKNSAHGLADDLRRLEEEANGMPITLDAIVAALQDRGHAVVIILLTAPFVILPIPGLSTIVGLAVIVLAFGILLNKKPWLPRFIGKRPISPEGLHRIIGGTNRVLRCVEKRMTGKSWHGLIGVSLILCTIALALPIPVPGNNIPPAIGILLLALGLLERDGLLVLIGHLYTLVLWAGLIALSFFFWDAVDSYVLRLLARVGRAFD